MTRVSTTDDGPWSATRGYHYNVTFTLHACGSQAKWVMVWVTIPNWHAVAFVNVNDTQIPFKAILSQRPEYVSYYVIVGQMNPGTVVNVEFTIVTAMSVDTGPKTIYYYCTWRTAEGRFFKEVAKAHQQTVTIS